MKSITFESAIKGITFGGTLLLAVASWAQDTKQASAGWCSQNVANVQGSVTIICQGVSPDANERLNKELAATKLSLADKIKEAEDWATRYRELEAHLTVHDSTDPLAQQAKEALDKGDLERAGALLDQILSREEKTVEQAAANHFSRAQVYQLQFQPLNALPHLEKAYRYRPENPSYGLAYAKLIYQQHNLTSAENIYKAVLDQLQERVKSDPAAYQPYMAQALNGLGVVYTDTLQPEKAERYLKEALRIRRELRDRWYDPDLKRMLTNLANLYYIQLDVSKTLNNLGNLYTRTKRLREAEQAYKEALDIRRSLATNYDSAVNQLDMTSLLSNLGALYDTDKRFEEADLALNEALQISLNLAKNDPTAYNSNIGDILINLGALYFNTQRLNEAEQAFQKALQIYSELTQSNPAAYQPNLAQTLYNLGHVYFHTGWLEEADKTYKKALQIRRELATQNPAVYRPDVAATLNSLGVLYRATQRPVEAERVYQEALQAYRELAIQNPATYRPDVAATLNVLGVLYRATQRPVEAERAYQEALQTYRELATQNPAAYLPDVAKGLENLADFYKANQRLEEAGRLYRALDDLRNQSKSP